MALEVEGVTAGYGSITVLRDVSLRVADGEILGVLGRNGMGKSTLIRCISGLIPASAGALRFDGPRHHRPAAAPAGPARHHARSCRAAASSRA